MQTNTSTKIPRRQFLAYSGLAVAGASMFGHSGGNASPAQSPVDSILKETLKYRKIDSHNHVNGRWSVEELIESADRVGIDKVAISKISGPEPDKFRASNDLVLKAMKRYPDRLLGQCFINPVFQKESLEEIDRCMDQGMVQLGELYIFAKISDPLYYPIIEKCIDLKIPIMMHAVAELGALRPHHFTLVKKTASVAADFVEIANRYPEMNFVHAHIGGGGDWEYMCKTLQPATNCYLDTGGSVTDNGMIDFAVKHLGAERLLFSTDINYEAGVGKIMAANLTEKQRKMIFYDNYYNLIKGRIHH